jgi:hypothetical protein
MRFRFEAPGARNAAMGGTSEALEDTFSTNPAALARIRERRVSVDARRSTAETEFITSGTIGSFQTMSLAAKSSGIQSATVVIPTRAATLALFVDEPMNSSFSTNALPRGERAGVVIGIRDNQLVPSTDCPLFGEAAPSEDHCNFAFFDTPVALRADTRVSLRRMGGVVAFGRGPVSFGASVQYAHLEERASADGVENRANGSRVTWSAGGQWQISPTVRAGASYRSGAKFAATRTFSDPQIVYPVRSFNTPSSYGAGLAFDVAPNVTIAIDAVRVRYNKMLAGVNPFTTTADDLFLYVMPDVTELHAGGEVRIPTRIPVSLRAGWWRDPAHRIRIQADAPAWLLSYNTLLRDEDEDHVTAGIGVGDRIRLDAAIDKSEHTTRGSLTIASTF